MADKTKVVFVTGQELVLDAPPDQVQSHLSLDKSGTPGQKFFRPFTTADDPPKTVYLAGDQVLYFEAL
jgi:hypothetical protein